MTRSRRLASLTQTDSNESDADMNSLRIRISPLILAAALVLPAFVLGAGEPIWKIDPIAPVEAGHLVEAVLPKFIPDEIRPLDFGGRDFYEITGTAGGAPHTAKVDAGIARLLWIKSGRKPVYKFGGVVTVGHRGTVRFGPENTIAGFEAAIERGIDVLEMDIRETADGHLVIMHDVLVNRTTDGRGPVHRKTLAEIKALDAGSWYGSEYAGERVPTLREVLEAIDGRALPDLDFKAGTPEKLLALVREFNLEGRVTLHCGDPDLMRRTIALDRHAFIIRPTVRGGRTGLAKILYDFNPPVINIDWRDFSEPLIQSIHLAGKKAFVNTLGPGDGAERIRAALAAGADYIQSDHLDLLAEIVEGN